MDSIAYMDMTLAECDKVIQIFNKNSREESKIEECIRLYLGGTVERSIFFYPYGRFEIHGLSDEEFFVFTQEISSAVGRRIDILCRSEINDGISQIIARASIIYKIIDLEIRSIYHTIYKQDIEKNCMDVLCKDLIDHYLEMIVADNRLNGEDKYLAAIKINYNKKIELLREMSDFDIIHAVDIPPSLFEKAKSFLKENTSDALMQIAYGIAAAAIWEFMCTPIIATIFASHCPGSIPVERLKGKYPGIELLLEQNTLSLEDLASRTGRSKHSIIMNMNYLQSHGVISINCIIGSYKYTLISHEMMISLGRIEEPEVFREAPTEIFTPFMRDLL